MKKILAILLFLVCLQTYAVNDIVRGTLTHTNATTNGCSITFNASVRSWTSAVSIASSQIATNSTAAGSSTNLLTHLGVYGVAGITFERTSSNAFQFYGRNISVSIAGNWASLVLVTNPSTNMTFIGIPFSNLATTNATNYASQLARDVSTYSTSAIPQISTLLSEVVGKTNAQTLTGAKTLQSFNGTIVGTVTNGIITGGIVTNANIKSASSISGTLGDLTNGVANGLTLSNSAHFGATGFSSRSNNAAAGEQFGQGSIAIGDALAVGTDSLASETGSSAFGTSTTATGQYSTAIGWDADAPGAFSLALGEESEASGENSTALGSGATAGHLNSTAVGYGATTGTSNVVELGSAVVSYVHTVGRIEAEGGITNLLTTGPSTNSGGWSFSRFDNSSLANGANAGINIGTNTNEKVYVKVSGPTAAFTINGIAGGRNGRVLEIQNSTGYAMTIANDSGVDPVAANRIYTGTGGDASFTNNPALVCFRYDSAASRWVMQTVSGTVTVGGGTPTLPIQDEYTTNRIINSGTGGAIDSGLILKSWNSFDRAFFGINQSGPEPDPIGDPGVLGPYDCLIISDGESGAHRIHMDGRFSQLGSTNGTPFLYWDEDTVTLTLGSGVNPVEIGGSLQVDGKITGTGGVDPPYVLYDAKTRAETKARVLIEVPVEKQTGAAQFWNPQTHRLEIYIASEDKFYDLNGNLLGSPTAQDFASATQVLRKHESEKKLVKESKNKPVKSKP